MLVFNNILYVANKGGIAYASDWDSAAAAATSLTWTDTTPAFTGATLEMPNLNSTDGGGLGKIRPGEKGIPILAEHDGYLYMARNVSVGTADGDDNTNLRGELWVCDPASTGGATTCESADWTRIIHGTETDLGDAHAISLVQSNKTGILYVGFDSPSTGVRIYRYAGGTPTTANTDFDLDTDIEMSETGRAINWELQGVAGLNLVDGPYVNIYSSASISDGSFDYFYLTVGTGSEAIRVLRQLD